MSERLLRVESANELNQSQSDIQRDSTFHNKIPERLKRSFIMSIIFVLIGIGLLVAGIIKAILSDDIQSSLPYWILSVICLIPGLFYSIQFLRAKLEKNIEYRRNIIDNIPEL